MMSHKDCEELAALIAKMQNDKSYHPVYNKKGVKDVGQRTERSRRTTSNRETKK